MRRIGKVRDDLDVYACYRISCEDVIWSKRGEPMEDWHQKYIVDAWNKKENTSLSMVIQDAINKYKIEIGEDEKQTVLGLLIKKRNYQYRFVVSDQSHYYEYELPGDYLYIVIRSHRQSSQAEIKIANYVRKCLSQ